MEYTKDFKERGELLQQLEARGLAIPDRAAALDFLTREVRLRAAITHTFAAKSAAPQASKEFLDAQRCDRAAGQRTKFEAWTKTSSSTTC